MYRDFTNEELEKLLGYVRNQDESNRNVIWSIADFFSDLAGDSDLDVDDYINDIDGYHKKLIDAENMTAKRIKQIFEAVHEQDKSTLTNIDIINGLADALAKYVQKLKGYIDIGTFKDLNGNVGGLLANPKEEYLNHIKNTFDFFSVKKCAEIYDAYRDGDIKKVEKYLKEEVNDLSRDVGGFGGVPGANIKKIREEVVVDLYRLINSDSAKKFDELFDSCKKKISEFDRYNIMYLAYTAEEPYKSLFLNSLGKFELGEFGSTVEISHFDPGDNKIKFDGKTTWIADSRGAYYEFFHEYGHGIDFHAMIGDDYYSAFYDYRGNYNLIYSDIRGRIKSEIEEQIESLDLDKSTQSKYIKEITESIVYKKGDVSHLSDNTEKTICKRVIRKMCTDLQEKVALSEDGTGPERLKYYTPADIYGGATDGTIMGISGSGHPLYDDDDKDGQWDDGEGYFYPNKDGERTIDTSNNALEEELWADYYSYNMIGNKKAIKWAKEYLPKTIEKYDEMAKNMDICVKDIMP